MGKYCPECGKRYSDTTVVCEDCGEFLKAEKPTRKKKKRKLPKETLLIVLILLVILAVILFPVISHARYEKRVEKMRQEYEKRVEKMRQEHEQEFREKQNEWFR